MYPRGLRLDDTLSTATDKSGKKEKKKHRKSTQSRPLRINDELLR